jgi:penicillin amidase
MIVDVGEWDKSVSALPGGQSGHPASSHYQDQIDDWIQGRYHPMLFSRAAVERAAAAALTLQPVDRFVSPRSKAGE